MSELTEVWNFDSFEEVRRSFRREKKTKLEQRQVCGWRQDRGWRWSWGASRRWGGDRGWGRCPDKKGARPKELTKVEECKTRIHLIDDGFGCRNWPKWETLIDWKMYEEVSEGKKKRSWISNKNRFVADAKSEVDAEAEARADAEAETEVEADVPTKKEQGRRNWRR